MPGSSLTRTGEQPPITDRGRMTRDLGPSDRSDTGSDIVGGPGISAEEADEALGLERGTTSDAEGGRGAGADIGDRNLDSDADASGTGERNAAGRDAIPPADETLRVVDDVDASLLIDVEDLDAALADSNGGPGEPDPDEPADDTPPEPGDDRPQDDPLHERPERPRS